MSTLLQEAAPAQAPGLATEQPWALALDLWPLAQAQRARALLAGAGPGHWALLTDAPCQPALLQALEGRLSAPLQWQPVATETLDALLAEAASAFRAMDALGASGGPGAADAGLVVHELSVAGLAEQASPVVRLIDSTVFDALQDGASDIHLECSRDGLVIRYRIDGVMLTVRTVHDITVAEQMVSRLKVMAELDIGERRLPQDGRFKLRVKGREIDFRLSIMPSVFGEDAVIRVLDRAQIQQAHQALTLEALGFDEVSRAAIRHLARLPHGMLLVTGPTGSGKTTTLYAAITEVNSGREKIITIEDPVEYQLPGVVQIPVNEKKGLTFERGLRSVLRHDPDRVMVGEIRDAQTAQIAVQAALTGHLVFSTVHANNAFDVIGRFMHMGLDLYNVVSALNGVVAQRLLRINCQHCTEPIALSSTELALMGLTPGQASGQAMQFARGRGCPHCRHTGYRGRHAVAELLLLDDELRDLIAARAPMSRIKEAARSRGSRRLREAALELVCQGKTTPEELDRVTLAD